MATKQEILNTVVAAATEACTNNKVSVKATEAIIEVLNSHLAPKTAGASVNLDEVTRKNDDGEVTEILCSLSNVWLPATSAFFYEAKDPAKAEGLNGLKRLSRGAEKARKQHLKVISTSEKAIMADIFDGEIAPEAGKKQLEDLKAQAVDYSSVNADINDSED